VIAGMMLRSPGAPVAPMSQRTASLFNCSTAVAMADVCLVWIRTAGTPPERAVRIAVRGPTLGEYPTVSDLLLAALRLFNVTAPLSAISVVDGASGNSMSNRELLRDSISRDFVLCVAASPAPAPHSPSRRTGPSTPSTRAATFSPPHRHRRVQSPVRLYVQGHLHADEVKHGRWPMRPIPGEGRSSPLVTPHDTSDRYDTRDTTPHRSTTPVSRHIRSPALPAVPKTSPPPSPPPYASSNRLISPAGYQGGGMSSPPTPSALGALESPPHKATGIKTPRGSPPIRSLLTPASSHRLRNRRITQLEKGTWRVVLAFCSLRDALALCGSAAAIHQECRSLCREVAQHRLLCDRELRELRRVNQDAVTSCLFGSDLHDSPDVHVYRVGKVLAHIASGASPVSVADCERIVVGDGSRLHYASVLARLETAVESEARVPGAALPAEERAVLGPLLARVDAERLSPVLTPLYQALVAFLNVPSPKRLQDWRERQLACRILRGGM
jgi:hypothetical protein